MAAAAAASSRRLLFIMSFSVFLVLPRATSLSFSFDFIRPGDPCEDGRLRCERDTQLGSGVLELTRNDFADVFSAGRATYPSAVPLWDSVTGEVASFTSNFTLQIRPRNETVFGQCDGVNGDGMAFFLGHHPSRIPPSSYGSRLGLFKDSSQFDATGDDRVVAVEFDKFKHYYDPSDNHVGIDVNSIDSKAYTNVDENLASDDAIVTARISYDNLSGLLAAQVEVGHSKTYNVSLRVDMKASLPEEVAVGFSAATGSCIELHQLLSWSFSSTLELPSSSNSKAGRHRRKLVPMLVPAAVLVVFFLLLCVIVGSLVRRRRKPTDGDSDREEAAELEMRGMGPRRYRYQELATATSNFAEEEKLGRGGFGSIYRGSLGDRLVAVKMFSAESSPQGRKAFEAEVKIISRLRHRNLVQLLGWCDSRRGLFLVYELVPEGSLDRHLYGSLLTWSERYKIMLGLGSALRYLHTEWDQCVLHGDIKPSNILLDSSHSTKLGDFGLARLVDHGAGPRTTQVVMGTAGYIDPAFIRTRRPSVESDVYSFGVVLLEMATGRRPEMEHPDTVIPLLRWVWDLYDRSTLLEAVDERLAITSHGKLHDDEEWQLQRVLVVGLWCAHPDPTGRPSIVQAMNVLQSQDVTLPVISSPHHDFFWHGHGHDPVAPPLSVLDASSCNDISWAVLSGCR
ncbi:hypothetical protein ACP4OV_013821 [Aristida adscensionis]